jgi:sensor c-di-GMP phosphodiesterase-like protein
MTIAGILLIGVLGIAIFNLLLSIASSTSVYELSKLQQEKRELTTTAQILGEQVDSLSSQQNLANAAESLGMISNANPVFLKLEGQKVYGQPQAALNTSGRAMKNMVPNSQLVKKSTAALIAADQLGTSADTKPDTASNQAKVAAPEVVSSVSGIPASPTN